jgi:hypothetical protein
VPDLPASTRFTGHIVAMAPAPPLWDSAGNSNQVYLTLFAASRRDLDDEPE